MTSADASREKELFLAAAELDAEQRDEFLARECASDPVLRARVEELLGLEPQVAGDFLMARPAIQVPVLGPGTEVAGYRLLGVLGEGGMGTVYEAQQAHPPRRVAFKVVRHGSSSVDSIKRLRLEAQLLGRLQHSGIAHVYEAGTMRWPGSERELPFFAMELVRGRPLQDYVERRGLEVNEVLELVARVCDAVHHAHQRGVLHRDLKSENVLVVEEESSRLEHDPRGSVVGQPKVLDFGVARALDPDISSSLETRAGDLIGTLSSMAPEQLRGDGDSADVRSDVYGLGVLLYRALSGHYPVPLEGLNLAQAMTRIQESAPAPLSHFGFSCRGDLEVLVEKALAKDPERRLQSSAELAHDLRCIVRGQPIRARADSRLNVVYRALRRHWLASSAALLVVLAFVTFATVTTLQSRRNRILSEHLTEELRVATVERGRNQVAQGSPEAADELLWPEFLCAVDSRHARWGLWELFSQTPCLGTWITHEKYVGEVAIAPDGKSLISGGLDGTVFRAGAGDSELVLDLGRGVHAVAFHPDGDLVALGQAQGRLGLYRFPSLELERELTTGKGPVHAIRFHPDGRLFCTGGGVDIQVWDPRSGEKLREYRDHDSDVLAIDLSPDGRRMVTSGWDTYALYYTDLEAGEPTRLSVGAVQNKAVALSPDGRHLAVGGGNKRIVLYDLSRLEKLDELLPVNGHVEHLTFQANHPELLISGGWYSTQIWNVESRLLERRIGYGSVSLDLHEPTMQLVINRGRMLRWLDFSGGGTESLPGHEGWTSCEAHPTNGTLVTGDERGSLRFWSLERANLLRTHSVCEARIRTLNYSANGKRLAVGCEDWKVRVLDASSLEELFVVDRLEELTTTSADLSPDGTLLVEAAQPRRARVFEVDSGALICDVEIDSFQAVAVRFHPDGERFVSLGRGDQVVRLWNLEGELLHEFPMPSAPWTPTFSRDGSRLAVTSWDYAIYVFDVDSGEFLRRLEDHRAHVWDACFDPTDPTLVATASSDGSAKLWDVDTGLCLASWEDYAGQEVFAVAIDPSGGILATSGRDGATLHSLSYFDRHVANHVPIQLERFAPPDLSVEQRTRVEAWAGEVLARPWPPVEW